MAARQNKSGTKPPRKKTSAPTTGGATNGAREVGASFQLSVDDTGTVQAIQERIHELQRLLGDTRTEYLRAEAQLHQAILKINEEYQALVLLLARKNGLAVDDQQWKFDAEVKSYTRTA